MAKLIDLTGKRFGRLTVLEYCKGGKWRCKCDCGNYTDVLSCNLRNGSTKSCGCLNKEHPNCDDLTGKRFGRLVVLERAGTSKNGHVEWKCKCDCGNQVIVMAPSLKNGKVSCGCAVEEKRNEQINSLIGRRFGKLTVIGLGDDLISPSGKRTKRWLCQCDCGNKTLVTRGSLVSGDTKGCGCLIGKAQGKTKSNSYEIVGNYAYITIGGT